MHWAPLFVLLSAPTPPQQQAVAEALAFSFLPGLGRDQQMLYAALAANESVRMAGLQERAAERRGESQALAEIESLLEAAMEPKGAVEADEWPILARRGQVLGALGDFARRVRRDAEADVRENFTARERRLLVEVVALLNRARLKPKNRYLSPEEVQEAPALYARLQRYDLLQQVLRPGPSPAARADASGNE